MNWSVCIFGVLIYYVRSTKQNYESHEPSLSTKDIAENAEASRETAEVKFNNANLPDEEYPFGNEILSSEGDVETTGHAKHWNENFQHHPGMGDEDLPPVLTELYDYERPHYRQIIPVKGKVTIVGTFNKFQWNKFFPTAAIDSEDEREELCNYNSDIGVENASRISNICSEELPLNNEELLNESPFDNAYLPDVLIKDSVPISDLLFNDNLHVLYEVNGDLGNHMPELIFSDNVHLPEVSPNCNEHLLLPDVPTDHRNGNFPKVTSNSDNMHLSEIRVASNNEEHLSDRFNYNNAYIPDLKSSHIVHLPDPLPHDYTDFPEMTSSYNMHLPDKLFWDNTHVTDVPKYLIFHKRVPVKGRVTIAAKFE